MRVDVWTDYVCPFCYLQVGVLDRFIQEARVVLDVHWHAFELRPEPIPLIAPDGEYIKDIWVKAVYPLAAERDVKMTLPPVAPRSRNAFETAYFSRTVGTFDVVHRTIFKAYFEDGWDIGVPEVLIEIAAGCGTDREALRESLHGRHFETEIIEDEAAAGRLGVTGLPFVMLSRIRGDELERAPVVVRGVAPVDHLGAALNRLLSQEDMPV